jgi:signal transduction histidine kinase
MNETDLYLFLEKKFIATFLDELMPGIFHNFANPLNGIMGRSKLMQRRLDDFVRKIENRYPEIEKETSADCKKLISDINAINDASEEFFDMFRSATGKFYALDVRDVESLNLSALIEAELGFADFYLDFKHNVKKEIHLDMGVPSITGITAYYSVAIWMLIREAAKNAQKRSEEPFRIVTTSDDPWVIVSISHIGGSLVPGWREILFPVSADPDPLTCGTDGEKNLICALMLFRLVGGGVEMTHDGDADLFTIRIRYQP